MRYSPSNCFDTFAFPAYLWQTANPALAAIGEQYHEHRRALMRQLWLGLTPIYNLFHAPDLTPDLVAKVSKQPEDTAEAGYHGLIELRRLHVALDHAIRDAYGWGGSEIANNEVGSREKALSPYPATLSLPLDHDFYEVETLPENDRVRYTISPSARKELLVRLLALNHQRAKEEKEGKKKVFVQENESKSQAPATLQLHPTEPPPPKLKQSTSVEPLTVSPSPIVAFTPPQGSFSQRLKRVHSLGQPQNQSELTELIAALGDEDGNIRWLAGSSLSRLGDLNVVHLLVAFLHTRPTEIAQQEGKRVLALIAQISDDEAVKETIQRSAIQNSKDF